MDEPGLTPWPELSSEQQLGLREAYGHYLDTLPPTCNNDTKNARFQTWLVDQGVRFP